MKYTAEVWDRILETLIKIRKHYGPPFYGEGQTIRLVVKDEPKADWYGYWDHGSLWVNVGGATWKEIVGTLIHEYAHHQQDPNDWDYDYEEEPERRAEQDLHLFL